MAEWHLIELEESRLSSRCFNLHPIPLIWTSDIRTFCLYGPFYNNILVIWPSVYGLFAYMDHFSWDKRGPYIRNWVYFNFLCKVQLDHPVHNCAEVKGEENLPGTPARRRCSRGSGRGRSRMFIQVILDGRPLRQSVTAAASAQSSLL